MEKNQNTNHPKKGSSIKVEPIREMKDIKNIKRLLADNPRNFCLFVFGINTNLRAGDLLKITAGEVRHKKAGDSYLLKEQKTGKNRTITLNESVVEAVKGLLSSKAFEDTDYLFEGKRGVLKVPSVNRLVKGWCREINLKGNYGSHTLRKTFGYMQRTQLNTGIPELMIMFNHSSQNQTLDYLCIQPEEIKDAYMQLAL